MTIKERIKRSAAAIKEPVVFTNDFLKFGSRTAIQKVLKELCKEYYFFRLGYGMYAKTRLLSNGERVIMEGLGGYAAAVFRRLGIKYDLGKLAREYAANRTTQIPGKEIFEIYDSGITRKISLGGCRIYYESYGKRKNI